MEGTQSIVARYARRMPVSTLFATRVYTKSLKKGGSDPLNARLLRECRQLSVEDAAGIRWSAANYPGGYTSYNSLARMHQMSPTFAALEKRIDANVRDFARTLDFDLTGRKLVMTDCWVNVMTRQVVHGLHLHPLATLSGTYYVRTPRKPGVGHGAGRTGKPGAVRELAAPRGGAEPHRGGAHFDQLQLFLVLTRWF